MGGQGPWIHRVIVEPNGSDHRGSSYITWVTKTGRIITHNTKYIHGTPISAEEYLYEQIRKATGQLESVQVLPTESDGPFRKQVQDHSVGVTKMESKHLWKRGKKKGNTLPLQPGMSIHNECTKRNTPPTRQIGNTGHGYNNNNYYYYY